MSTLRTAISYQRRQSEGNGFGPGGEYGQPLGSIGGQWAKFRRRMEKVAAPQYAPSPVTAVILNDLVVKDLA
jgi:hypothetical protein